MISDEIRNEMHDAMRDLITKLMSPEFHLAHKDAPVMIAKNLDVYTRTVPPYYVMFSTDGEECQLTVSFQNNQMLTEQLLDDFGEVADEAVGKECDYGFDDPRKSAYFMWRR